MAPPVKIKDGRRVAAQHCAAVADGYLLPYLCPNTAVLGSGRGHRSTRQGGAGAAGWEDIYIILECMPPPCGCLHCTEGEWAWTMNIHDLRSEASLAADSSSIFSICIIS